jgi:hypothetical protein
MTLDAGSNITTGNVTLNASTLDATAHNGSITLGVVNGTVGSDMTLDAGEDITTGDVTLNNSELKGTAHGGDINLGDVSMTGQPAATDRSKATLSAGGDILTDVITLTRSTLDATAGGAIDTDDITAITGSTLTFDAGGFIHFPMLIATASTVKMDADGEISFSNADLSGSTVWMATRDDLDETTPGDITFSIIEGVDTDLDLISSGGGIYTDHDWSYLYLRGSSDITMSARDDIGLKNRRLIVDIPAAMALKVLVVDNYFIDAVELIGNKFLRARQVLDIRDGRDDGGVRQTGDYLGDGGFDELYPILAAQTPEELAAWLATRTSRDTWSELLTEQALSALIQSGDIAKTALKALLVSGTFKNKDLTAAYAAGQYDLLATMLRTVLDVTPPDPTVKPATAVKYVADQQALTWLAAAIEAGVATNLEDTLHAGMTLDDLTALLGTAWTLADYDSHLDTEPDDPDARTFTMHIGESFGEGHVWNEGDITIVQERGNLTAADIHSDRGDISITTQGGSILGAASDVANVRGTHIVLSAFGSIGSALRPLTTEQQNNRPTLVGNIVDPPLDADGNPTVNPDGEYLFTLLQQPLLDELGQPVLNELLQPVLQWVLYVKVDYDWLRVEYLDEATRMDATAGGDLFVSEVRGDMGIGVLEAGGDVGLSAPGSILDVRAEDETQPNLDAGGDASFTSESGTIGLDDDYIDVDVDGVITAEAFGDINFSDLYNLILIADSLHGQVNADAIHNLTLSNTVGNLIIGPIYAGNDITITAQGSILPGDRLGRDAQVKGHSIALTALNGTVGVKAAPMDVDTDAEHGGTLSVTAASTVYVRELTGDVRLLKFQSGADATLIVPDNLIDANPPVWDEAMQQYLKTYRDYSAYTAAATFAQVLRAYADEIKAVLDAINEKVDALETALIDLATAISDLQDQIDSLDPAQKALLKKLQKKLGEYQVQANALAKKLDTALTRQGDVQDAFDTADADATEAEYTADHLRSIVEASAEQTKLLIADALSHNTIDVDGNLSIVAGGSVGETGHAVSMLVGGVVTIDQGDNPSDELAIASGGDITLSGIDASGNVTIIALGNIQMQPGKILKAQVATLIALGNPPTIPVIVALGTTSVTPLAGDIGTKKNPITVMVEELTAAGNNVYIRSLKPLTIDMIIAANLASIEADGSIQGVARADDDDSAHITAGTVVLDADGGVGTKSNPLILNVDTLKLTGNNVTLTSISDMLEVSELNGYRVTIYALGNILGGILYANRLKIDAYGSVWMRYDPLLIWVPGAVDIGSIFGHVNYINLYRSYAATETTGSARTLSLMRLPLDVVVNGESVKLTLLIAAVPGTNGSFAFLGAWLVADKQFETLVSSLKLAKAQGLGGITSVRIEASSAWIEAVRQVFPGVQIQDDILMWILGELMDVDASDVESLLVDLETVLTAADEQAAVQEIDRFTAKWGAKYAGIASHLTTGWADRAAFYAKPASVRKSEYNLAGLARFILSLREVTGRSQGFASESDIMEALTPVLKAGILPAAGQKA